MQNVNTGYRITFGHSKNIHAFMNTIRANRTGMELLFNDAANQLDVADNNIIFGKAGSPIHAYGIRVEENGLYNNMSNIHGNEINFYQGAQKAFIGILVQAANHIAINDNQIHMHNNRTDMYGVGLAGGSNQVVSCNHIGCNTIDKYSSNPLQAGIITGMGQDHIIKCNQIDSTWNGIFVKGNLTGSATVIETNEFNLHEYAFRIGVTSTLQQPQSYKGNLWFSNALTTNGLNSFHENYLNNAFTNFVEDPPPANHLPFANSQNPPDWFKKFPGLTDQVCIKGLDCNGSAKAGNSSTPQDRDIATDSVSNDPYTQETLWLLRSNLYSRADANPALLLDSVINSFYFAMHYTNTDALKNVENAKKLLGVTDSVWVQYVHVKDSLVFNYLEGQNYLMSLIDSSSMTDTVYLAYLMSGINASKYLINATRATMDSINNLRASLRNQLSDDALAINATVTSGVEIEDNERTVNQIYLTTIAKGIYEFDASQVASLFSIANQCPLSGGNSVFRARALYSLVDITARFDDTELCNRVGIQYRNGKIETEAPAFKIYPNPADESITVVCIGSISCKKIITIRDAIGKIVYSHSFADENKEQKIDISNLTPGVYHIQINCNEINFIDKLIKIH